MDYVQILKDIIQMNKLMTLTGDIMYVNNLPFVITYGQGIGLMMAVYILELDLLSILF